MESLLKSPLFEAQCDISACTTHNIVTDELVIGPGLMVMSCTLKLCVYIHWLCHLSSLSQKFC